MANALVIKEESTKVNDSKMKPYMIIFSSWGFTYKRSLIYGAFRQFYFTCNLMMLHVHLLGLLMYTSCKFCCSLLFSVSSYPCLNRAVLPLALVLHLYAKQLFLNLALLCYPIRKWNQNQTSLAVAHVFPLLASVTCICFEFWLVHWIVCVLCDWPEWFLWFWLYDTQLKTALFGFLIKLLFNFVINNVSFFFFRIMVQLVTFQFLHMRLFPATSQNLRLVALFQG